MAPVPGRRLRCPVKVDTGFAIGSILRLQVPRARMANGWALGKFGGEFGQGTDVPDRPDDVRHRRKTGSGLATANMTRLTLMRHLLLIGGGPIGVASAYIKRFSNHPNQAQPT